MVNIGNDLTSKISRAVELINTSGNTIILTGAGVSTPSGIPDFRSAGSGLWEHHNPMDVASLSTFRYNPKIFFDWMQPVARLIHNSLPNPAHISLSEMEKSGFVKAIITQNIDGLHQKAGSKNVIEVHGGMEFSTCISCFSTVATHDYIGDYLDHGTIPRCPQCANILKPNVILYEEQLPSIAWNEATKLVANCDLIIVVGTSLEVMPVASLPSKARYGGARVMIINNLPTYMDSDADLIIAADVAKIFPRILEELIGE